MRSAYVVALGAVAICGLVKAATNAPPAGQPPVAVVFGREIRASDLDPPPDEQDRMRKQLLPDAFDQWLNGQRSQRLASMIWQPLIDRYVAENSLEPTEAEVNQFSEIMNARWAESIQKFTRQREELTAKLRSSQVDDTTRSNLTSQVKVLDSILNMQAKTPGGFGTAPAVGQHMVKMWKFNKSLYEKYGGRVIFQQAGLEPLDAYRRFLEDNESRGAYRIDDPALRAKFWEYFTTLRHTDAGVKNPFDKPWWLMAKAPEEEPRQAAPPPAEAASLSSTGTMSSIDFRVSLEDKAVGNIKLELKRNSSEQETVRLLPNIQPGPVTLDLQGLDTGCYLLWASSPGYATQWVLLEISGGKTVLRAADLKLYRKRYAVIRYVVNTTGDRRLVGTDLAEGLCAVAHWGRLPCLGRDWQVWQHADRLSLDFFRSSGPGFGFALPPEGTSFNDLQDAPENDRYRCQNTLAKEGLTLFCRVNGNRPQDRCYGRIVVENVTETPPPNVQVIDGWR